MVVWITLFKNLHMMIDQLSGYSFFNWAGADLRYCWCHRPGKTTFASSFLLRRTSYTRGMYLPCWTWHKRQPFCFVLDCYVPQDQILLTRSEIISGLGIQAFLMRTLSLLLNPLRNLWTHHANARMDFDTWLGSRCILIGGQKHRLVMCRADS